MAVTVTYNVRGGNGLTILANTTGPTATQAQQTQKQEATVLFGSDADTQALFTHNWGLDASAPGYLEPEIIWYYQALPSTTVAVGFTFDVTNTNVVKINKASIVGSASTLIVTLRRPQSAGQ